MLVKSNNELYPVFLKIHQLNTLVVGGGKIAYEKLSFLLKSSPSAKVEVVAPKFTRAIKKFAKTHNVVFINDRYHIDYLDKKQLVIVATNIQAINTIIYNDCKKVNVLVNIADNPKYCDFYLGGIVTKGNVKIAISTNGKSPVIAKRLRQFFEDMIPDDIDTLVENLESYRKMIKGDFQKKVKVLNAITKDLINR